MAEHILLLSEKLLMPGEYHISTVADGFQSSIG